MILNGTEYKTILLDTNVLREFLFDNDGTQKSEQKKASLMNYLRKYIMDEPHVILISYYSMLELRPYEDLFNQFIDFYNLIPFFVVFPEESIIKQEYEHFLNDKLMKLDENSNQILWSVTYFKNTMKEFNKLFIEDLADKHTNQFIDDLQDIANHWEAQRKYTHLVSDKFYYKKNEFETIKNILPAYLGKIQDKIELKYFPGIRLMQYSQYKKVHFTKKPIVKNDVVDVKISCIVPYVDIVITENQQANFFKQSCSLISQMKNVEILTLKTLRLKK